MSCVYAIERQFPLISSHRSLEFFNLGCLLHTVSSCCSFYHVFIWLLCEYHKIIFIHSQSNAKYATKWPSEDWKLRFYQKLIWAMILSLLIHCNQMSYSFKFFKIQILIHFNKQSQIEYFSSLHKYRYWWNREIYMSQRSPNCLTITDFACMTLLRKRKIINGRLKSMNSFKSQ